MSEPTNDLPTPELLALLRTQQRHRERLARSTAAERRAVLEALERALRAHTPQLLRALQQDLGKAEAEARTTEIGHVLGAARHAAANVRRWMRPRRAPSGVPGLRAEVWPVPLGTVLILGPWNYPVTNLLSPLVDALAAGNTAILKPSERAPATARAIAAMVGEHFHPRLLAVVQGDASVARRLTALPFDHILFTGSTDTGREVMAAAARNLTPVTLELGGKSPALLHPDADLRLAARRIAWAKLLNAGQTCIAPDYALVPREQEAAFARELERAARALYGGDPQGSPDYGRVVDAGEVRRLREAVRGSVRAGARLEFGGRYGEDFDEAARFVAPTVLSGVDWTMPVMERELFGPVLPLLPYDDLGAAVAEVNRRPTPLAAYAFARDPQTARALLAQLRSGGGVVNGALLHVATPLPFGGRGASGMGHYHGEAGFFTFSHRRTVATEGRFSPSALLHPPYDRPLTRALLALRR